MNKTCSLPQDAKGWTGSGKERRVKMETCLGCRGNTETRRDFSEEQRPS